MPHKKPFSSKQKKRQLQEKRNRKRDDGPSYQSDDLEEDGNNVKKSAVDMEQINHQPTRKLGADSAEDINRYRLQFFKDSKEAVLRGKKLSQEPHEILSEKCLEVNVDEIHRLDTVMDIPKRQPWDYNLKKEVLDAKEETYFKKYLNEICQKHSLADLSYFELNLETWRQLWRVLEKSDILLIIVDIRHPALNFSPALYSHITKDLRKRVILILNKVDLAPPSLVVAWQEHLKEKFPELNIVLFSSFPTNSEPSTEDPGMVVRKRRRKGRFTAIGPRELCKACEELTEGKVDMSGWEEKIEVQMSGREQDKIMEMEADTESELCEENNNLTDDKQDGILTLGCLGYPNVGKSSLINGLVGKKVVSVSKTPGHTKHFQTIFLTSNVRLCDCPGLVFPSVVDKQLQILGGMYPIAQVREPYSVVKYVAERIDIPRLLKLQPLCNEFWSAFDICEAWAQKRGFVTAKTGRPDVYRAANGILRMVLEGRLCLCFRPPGFGDMKEYWEVHQDTIKLKERLKQKSTQLNRDSSEGEEESEEESEEDVDRGSTSKDKKMKEVSVSNPFTLLEDD